MKTKVMDKKETMKQEKEGVFPSINNNINLIHLSVWKKNYS